ncbi:MAG: S8 family serine peptidase [Bacteroidota bacterium]
MDTARAMQDVNRVHTGEGSLATPYLGTGVLVGVVDHGYEWSHPAFFSQDGQRYRVLRVWDQHRTVAATPPADYDYGHEMIGQTALLAAPIDSVAGFHGTHVLGIAAGSGLGSGKDRGMAPDADIVLVSSPFTRSSILDGIRYLFAQADALDKDMVINLSIGGFLGPRDGTSTFDQAVGELVGPAFWVGAVSGSCFFYCPSHLFIV